MKYCNALPILPALAAAAIIASGTATAAPVRSIPAPPLWGHSSYHIGPYSSPSTCEIAAGRVLESGGAAYGPGFGSCVLHHRKYWVVSPWP